MTAAGENKDGVWSFMRYLINSYEGEYAPSFPIHEERFNNMAAEAMTDAINDEELMEPIEPLSKDALERFRTLIAHSNKPLSHNQEITRIIGEDTAAFFAGRKSAAEVCEIIQSRVSLYLAEMM